MLAALGTIWAGAWLLATAPADAFTLPALTAVVAVALFAALARRAATPAAALAPTAVPVVVRTRASTRRTGPPRLCDPDAAGRPRPRAPSGGRAA